jgi:hypothetical protein
MPPSKIFIVILQYNNSQDTIKCLESVKELNWPDFEVAVVDNASEIKHLNNVMLFIESQSRTKQRLAAGPRGFVRDQAKNGITFHFLANNENLGYSGGNNTGIRYALKNGADYILILNPDTMAEKNLLSRLVKVMGSRKRTGILQPAIREDRMTFYGGGKIKWLNVRQPQSTAIPRSMIMKKDFYVMGSAMFIRKEVIEDAGLFDERYFLYFEDADYSLKARRAGYNLGIEKEALVNHRASASTGSPCRFGRFLL